MCEYLIRTKDVMVCIATPVEIKFNLNQDFNLNGFIIKEDESGKHVNIELFTITPEKMSNYSETRRSIISIMKKISETSHIPENVGHIIIKSIISEASEFEYDFNLFCESLSKFYQSLALMDSEVFIKSIENDIDSMNSVCEIMK